MKQTIIMLAAVLILLSSCQSRDGRYIVYKTELPPLAGALDEKLKSNYAGNEYILTFADKYVKLASPDGKQSLVLAKGEVIPGAEFYTANSIEGSDSVRVGYQLKVSSKDIVLTISARRKSYHAVLGADATVDFYLSRAKD